MTMTKRNENEKEPLLCPVGRFFSDLERISGKKTKFAKHLDRSRVELLKAIRSLIDDKIDHLEKRDAARSGKKMNKIKVE
jgi:hypothetical protein